jgi:hypothetical protein
MALGRELVELWTFQRPPSASLRWSAGGVTAAEFGRATWDAATDELELAGRQLEGVTADVWHFEVSGYRVLSEYVKERENEPADAHSMAGVRAVASAIAGIVDLGPQLDESLEAIIAGPML